MGHKLLFNNSINDDGGGGEDTGNWIDIEVNAAGVFKNREPLFDTVMPDIDSILLTLKARFNSTLSTIHFSRTSTTSGTSTKYDLTPIVPNQDYLIEVIRISSTGIGIKFTNKSTNVSNTINGTNFKMYGDCRGLTNTTTLKKKGLD